MDPKTTGKHQTSIHRFRRLRLGAKFAWRVVDTARRATMNGLFLLFVVLLVVVALWDGSPDIEDGTAVVLEPKGTIVEQMSGDPNALLGGGAEETLLRDVLETIHAAQHDDRVSVLVLDLSDLGNAGMSKLQEVGDALERFRNAGKKVVATADSYSQSAYYLAAHADEVHLHHMGSVEIVGLSLYQMYYGEALERLEVKWNIFRVGKFKSAVEPFIGTGMSQAAREANLAWMGDLWNAYLDDVASARGLSADAVRDYAERYDRHVAAVGGDAARAALDAGLVDHIGGRDSVRQRLIELVGEDEDKHTFNQVAGQAFLAEARRNEPTGFGRDAVAVIVARGTIQDGEQPPGAIGGDSTAALIRKARLDDDVKALVLRVDSGGGSAFASEVIRREFELARDAGKPVVVSMGSVAASGGYWISTASDEIWASPTTITGSIGIFGMFPTVDKPLANLLGVHVDGVSTSPMAGVRIDRPLDDRVAAAIQSQIDKGYQRFLEKVAKARGMTTDQVDEVAQGRVWSGVDAHTYGLVDKLGGLEEAIASAAALAELDDDYVTRYVEPERELSEQLARAMMDASVEAVGEQRLPPGAKGIYRQVVAPLQAQLEVLESFNDPHGIYAYAFIDVD